MNIKRFFIASAALFVFIFVYESLIHGHLLLNLYAQTPHAWREFSEIKALVPYNISIMIILSLWITFIFTRFFKVGGWRNGLKFGFYLGVLSGIQAAGAYYYLPISFTLVIAWFVFSIIECTLGGILIGVIYKSLRI